MVGLGDAERRAGRVLAALYLTSIAAAADAAGGSLAS